MNKANNILKLFLENSSELLTEMDRVRDLIRQENFTRSKKVGNIRTNVHKLFSDASKGVSLMVKEALNELINTKYDSKFRVKSGGMVNKFVFNKDKTKSTFVFYEGNYIIESNAKKQIEGYLLISLEMFIEPVGDKQGQIRIEFQNEITNKEVKLVLPFNSSGQMNTTSIIQDAKKNFETLFSNVTKTPSEPIKAVATTKTVTNNLNVTAPKPVPISVTTRVTEPETKTITKEDVKRFLKNFKTSLPRYGLGDWDDNVEEYDNKNLSYSVRNWGDWDVSDDDRNDPDYEDDDFEDWDNNELSSKDYKVANDAFNKYVKDRPEYAKMIKNHSIQTGEKNYLYFEITLK